MTVFFIGAGPGDPELLTLKAQRIICECPVCLYAGSLVPPEVVACAPEGAKVMDTAAMTLDDTHAEIKAAHRRGEDVARVHRRPQTLVGGAQRDPREDAAIELLVEEEVREPVDVVPIGVALQRPLERRLKPRQVGADWADQPDHQLAGVVGGLVRSVTGHAGKRARGAEPSKIAERSLEIDPAAGPPQ